MGCLDLTSKQRVPLSSRGGRVYGQSANRREKPSWEHIVNDARVVTRENIARCSIGCKAKGRKISPNGCNQSTAQGVVLPLIQWHRSFDLHMRPERPTLHLHSYELRALTNRAGTKPIRFWLARLRGRAPQNTEIEKREDQEKHSSRERAPCLQLQLAARHVE